MCKHLKINVRWTAVDTQCRILGSIPRRCTFLIINLLRSGWHPSTSSEAENRFPSLNHWVGKRAQLAPVPVCPKTDLTLPLRERTAWGLRSLCGGQPGVCAPFVVGSLGSALPVWWATRSLPQVTQGFTGASDRFLLSVSSAENLPSHEGAANCF